MNHSEYNPPVEDMTDNKITPGTESDLEAARPTTTTFHNKQAEPHCIQMCGVACAAGTGVLLILGLFGASVTYYVFCVMALIDNSNKSIQKTCSDSNLWAFLLTVLILNLGVAQNTSKSTKSKDGPNLISVVVSILILVSLCTWGSIEFWNDCVQEKLSDTLIFTMVKTTVYIEYAIILLLSILFVFIMNKAVKENK